MNRSRVTGDLTASGLLYADIANDRVGIGSTIPGNKLSLPDSAKIGLGNAEDLTAYHDGTDSWINSTTGDLKIRSQGDDLLCYAADDIYLMPQGNDNGVWIKGGGGVTLYHNNAKVLETDVNKIILTGNASESNIQFYTSDGNRRGTLGVTNSNSVTLYSGTSTKALEYASNALTLYHTGNAKLATTSTGINITGVTVDDGATHDGDVTFTGANYNMLWRKSANALRLYNNVQLNFGDGDEGDIYRDSSQMIVNNASGNLKLRSNSIHIAGTSNEKHIVSTTGFGVTAYYNNSAKLETTNTGISITGIPVATQSTGNVGLELHATGSGRGSQTKYHNDHGVCYVGVAGDTTGEMLVYNEANTALKFYTNGGSPRLTIAAGGAATFSGSVTATGGFSGSGASLTNVNATTLDSIDSGSFLRSDAVDSSSANITINGARVGDWTGGSTYKGLFHTSQSGSEYMIISGDTHTYISATTGSNVYIRNGNNDSTNQLIVGSGNDALTWRGNKVFHAGNDGSGSGLDADTLDGLNSSQFLRSDTADTIAGNLTVGTGNASYITMVDNDNGSRQIHCNSDRIGFLNSSGNWGAYCADDGSFTCEANLVVNGGNASTITMGDADEGSRQIHNNSNFIGFLKADGNWGSRCADDGSWQILGNTAWHAGNDGSGSGLDADLLDGKHDTSFLRSDAGGGAASYNATSDITFSGGASAVTIAANSDIRFTSGTWSGEAIKIQAHSNTLYVQGGTSGTIIRGSDGGDISLWQNGQVRIYDDTIFQGGAGAVTIGGNSDIRFNTGSWTGESCKIQHHSNWLYIQGGTSGHVFRRSNGSDAWYINSGGTFYPAADSTYDLGTNSSRIRDIYADNIALGDNGGDPSARLAIQHDSGHNIYLEGNGWSGEAGIGFGGAGTGTGVADGATGARIGATSSAPGGQAVGYLSFYTNPGDDLTERLRIDADGDVVIRSSDKGSMVNAEQRLRFNVHQTNGQSCSTAAIVGKGQGAWGGNLEFWTKDNNGTPNETLRHTMTLQGDNNRMYMYGDIWMDGDATTSNQSRCIRWTGFDKESASDFSDYAQIQHTTNVHGISGSVLRIESYNDANDGIALNAAGGAGKIALVGKMTGNIDMSSGGKITPSPGGGETGIKWNADPYGGSGDIATIQYYQDGSGEDTRLRILIANDAADDLRLEGSTVHVQGTLTAASNKGFRIPHVLAGLTTTTDLVHSAIEGPQTDNLYRGRTTLVAGISTVNIDTTNNMTDGTFVNLNRDVQCFTTNETGWTAIKGSVTGNQLTIIAQDNTCTDTISWMVIGERWDLAMYDPTNPMTNANGKLKTEIPNDSYNKGGDYEEDYIHQNNHRVGISTISRPSIENKEVE